ncbi:MAG: hypothetical protein R2780_02335 [Crocinitomicaceae bacterium]|nr:hypothetical protein [Crocinitomicaceae bacterium]
MKFLIPGILVFAMASCGGSEESTEHDSNDNADTTETADATAGRSEIDPFPDFPMVGLSASAGDIVLSPSKNWQVDATEKGGDQVTFIFYKQTLAEVGDQTSKVDFMTEKGVDIPNYMIIPIKPSQTTKKGDVILTWWQTGSGMQRAIVVDDADPAAPVVNYLDLKWDNPATTNDGIGIGQATYKIEPGTFHVLKSAWEPGTTVAAKDGGKVKNVTVVRAEGDQVLTIGWGGTMKIYAKADCTPVPVMPTVKAGDAVQAPWVGSYTNTTVVKVDAKFGRVWCDDPYSDDPMVIPYGDVATNLVIE